MSEKRRRVAVCPGSFDPVTYGHLDIISRASKLFDKVIVLVSANLDKKPSFTLTERLLMIEQVTTGFDNIVIDILEDELLADYVRRVGADAIVKGLRAVTDFEYEFQMALGNKKLCPEAETVFLTTAAENMYLSSSIVKQIAILGGDISSFVPPEIQPAILERLRKKKPDSPNGAAATAQELRQVQQFANAIRKEESE
ncbi:MAG: pantetheine-phosphate adenylyltransferase [Oscillospiraceae bacterium]|nr:pantetheine-phosphate adenylyltransferase [Oscillospiraceae bacterium]